MLTELHMGLQSAIVLTPAKDRARVRLPEGETWARVALAFPYRLNEGDEVLVARQEESFIIGVLKGSGACVFETPGDIEFNAGGKLSMRAAERVEIRAPGVLLRAGKMQIIARSVVEKFGKALRRVAGLFKLRTGESRTIVEGAYRLNAQRIVDKAVDDVKINGSRIDLG
jgi:hypothetical protein